MTKTLSMIQPAGENNPSDNSDDDDNETDINNTNTDTDDDHNDEGDVFRLSPTKISESQESSNDNTGVDDDDEDRDVTRYSDITIASSLLVSDDDINIDVVGGFFDYDQGFYNDWYDNNDSSRRG